MVRSAKQNISNFKFQISNLDQVSEIADEGIQTYCITKYLLLHYPRKKWVIDGGALQMMDPMWLRGLSGNVIVTPHKKEFNTLFGVDPTDENAKEMAKKYNCIVLLKGPYDIVCSPTRCVKVEGGNAGMTKGGTGDVLAGLVAALACKNDLFLAALAGSYINKKAGDSLFANVGYYFNASDLIDEIPHVMKEVL